MVGLNCGQCSSVSWIPWCRVKKSASWRRWGTSRKGRDSVGSLTTQPSIIQQQPWEQERAKLALLMRIITSFPCLIYFRLVIRMEKAMAPHSSTPAWKTLWTEEPGRLQSMGLQRVRHDWATSLSLFTFMHWRRKWQPTPVFLLGESQGRGSLEGCRLWGRTESDTTEAT